MTVNRLLGGAVIAVMLLGAGAAQASSLDLEGVVVQAELFLDGNHYLNYFDPANGRVPPGFGNSSSDDGGSGEAEALISDSVVEFGYEGTISVVQIQADFAPSGMISFSGTSSSGPIPFSTQMNFFSPILQTPSTPFSLTLVTAINLNCGLNGSLSCTTVANVGSFSGTFQLTPQQVAVPAPASLALLAVGLAGMIARRRIVARRRR